MSSLDLLRGVAEISEFLFGDASVPHQRRVRHLVRHHALPVRRYGGRIKQALLA